MAKSIERRNDYIASIRSDMSDANLRLRTIEEQLEKSRELRDLSKFNREWKIWRMARYEERCLKKQARRLRKTKKELARHLYLAEKWIV